MPRIPAGSGKAYNPPTSEGLPPSRHRISKVDRYKRAHPGKPGRPTLVQTETIITETLARMDTETPAEIAKSLGRAPDFKPVRAVIKAARAAFALRAEDYVALHYQAAMIAAEQGDAKPAQWALERLAEQGDRVVDAPQQGSSTAPSLQIGIALGGLLKAGPEPVALPPIEVTAIDITKDMP